MNPILIISMLCGIGWLLWQGFKNTDAVAFTSQIFDNTYVNTQGFYMQMFHTVPNIKFVKHVDTAKAYAYFNSGQVGAVLATYQKTYYDWQQQEQVFSSTLFQIENQLLVELGEDYAEILFGANDYDRADSILNQMVLMKAEEKEDDHQINIIAPRNGGLTLKQLSINATELDVGLHYNDDFKAVHEYILKRLLTPADKGIVLLHGLPGTGKTTYLRYLVGKLNKKVLFVPAALAENLMNPELMDLLMDYPNAVLVIEDAETVVAARKYHAASGVSTLLNLSDGLLSDCLNLQVVCTFNSAINTVDAALLRKGRLIASYEFGKLTVQKSQQLAAHLGYKHTIDRAMTLAEVCNPEVPHRSHSAETAIGFRQPQPIMN
ncbi:MAG: AAA family ATPase [Bacteroidetes bacterium]|nr:MAG: AAA family ATPase [Bacteroidota bacterium]